MLLNSVWVRPFQWNRLCTVLSVPFACLAVISKGCVQRSFNPSAGQVRGSTVDASELQRLDNGSVQDSLDLTFFDALEPASPQNRDARLADANKMFSREDVCADWELGIHLLALIQTPAGRQGANLSAEEYARRLAACPGNYTDTAAELLKLQLGLKDFHTSFEAPSLTAVYAPTVKDCSVDAECGSLVGGTFVPLETALERRAHARVAGADGTNVYFEILKIDDRDTSRVYDDLILSERVSRLQWANAGRLGPAFFLRHVLEKPSGSHKLFVKRLDTGALARMTVTFDEEPSRPPPDKWTQGRRILRDRTNYVCDEEITTPEGNAGACLLDGNRGLVWVASFSAGGHEVLNVLRKLVRRYPQVSEKPLVLDLRGNGGGSPELAGQLACQLGGEPVADIIGKRELVASAWPEAFELSDGTRVESASLVRSGNNDLARRKNGWVVSSKNPDPARVDFSLPFFKRFEPYQDGLSSPARCKDLHGAEFRPLKWVILTSGREFSATENFLSFIEPLNDRFAILGRTTWGGTGAPSYVTLPRTKMRMRLSLARHLDRSTGLWAIEGIGIKPDVRTETETAADLERWFKAAYAKQDTSKDKTLRPKILKDAVGFDGFR